MYLPRSFKEEDLPTLHALMRENSFAVLFSQTDDMPFATHLPFMVDSERGRYGTLIAHMARANPHWRQFEKSPEVLVIFQGPHAYISPAWYEDQVTVPTWNYAAVHAHGRPKLIHDKKELRGMVENLVRIHEKGIDSGWDIAQAEPIMETELKAIVGFEIPISRIEGKFKFNQNRSEEDRKGVIRALEKSDDPMQRIVAEVMRRVTEHSAWRRAHSDKTMT